MTEEVCKKEDCCLEKVECCGDKPKEECCLENLGCCKEKSFQDSLLSNIVELKDAVVNLSPVIPQVTNCVGRLETVVGAHNNLGKEVEKLFLRLAGAEQRINQLELQANGVVANPYLNGETKNEESSEKSSQESN